MLMLTVLCCNNIFCDCLTVKGFVIFFPPRLASSALSAARRPSEPWAHPHLTSHNYVSGFSCVSCFLAARRNKQEKPRRSHKARVGDTKLERQSKHFLDNFACFKQIKSTLHCLQSVPHDPLMLPHGLAPKQVESLLNTVVHMVA